MRRETSRAAASSEPRGKEKASRAPAGRKKSELDAGSEPALLVKRDVDCCACCSSVLQCGAVRCSALQCVVERCSVL